MQPLAERWSTAMNPPRDDRQDSADREAPVEAAILACEEACWTNESLLGSERVIRGSIPLRQLFGALRADAQITEALMNMLGAEIRAANGRNEAHLFRSTVRSGPRACHRGTVASTR